MPEKCRQSGKSRRNNNIWGGYDRLKDAMYKLTIFGVALTAISYSGKLCVEASYNGGEDCFLCVHIIIELAYSLLSFIPCSVGPPPGYGQAQRGQYGQQQQQGQQYGQRQQGQGQQQQPPPGGQFGGPPQGYGQSSRQPGGGPPPGFGQQSVLHHDPFICVYVYL